MESLQRLFCQSILHFVWFLFLAPFVSGSLDVHLRTGTFRGVATPNATEKWLGIPYALPPVGSLRFKAPQPIVHASNTVKNASTFGNACPQPPGDGLGAPLGEDCLFLNVWRPENTAENARLPVLLWIHGGAYTNGAASQPSYDPTRIVGRSVAVKKPIVFVSINYRVNTFGFLSSSLMAPEDLNAGLLDQRMAMTFVQDNIAAFGGDPSKVTIWGQSAGAGSVESHFLFPSERPLFRAGIADSSTGPFKSSPPASTYDKAGLPFNRLLSATGCSFGPSAISCLQDVPFETLLNISNAMIDSTLNSQLWQPSIGPKGSFASVRASTKIESGDFVHVPYLAGTNLNEGTTFSGSVRGLNLTGSAQNAAFKNFVGHLFIDNSTITQDLYDEILEHWPANDPREGAPFNTGDSLFDRAAAWYTDAMFLAPRRFFFERASTLQPTFAYHFREFIPGNDPSLGGEFVVSICFFFVVRLTTRDVGAFAVFHASELVLLFGPVPTSVEDDFANTYLDFYINFINDLNPGADWPLFSNEKNQVLQLMRDNITLIPDDFDTNRTTFLNTQTVFNAFQK